MPQDTTDQQSPYAHRRAHVRRLLTLNAELVPDDGGSKIGIRLIDLSLSGAGFVRETPLAANSRHTLECSLPPDSDLCRIHLEVVYCVPLETTGLFRCGARFVELDPSTQAKLMDFITLPPRGST